MFNSPEIIKAVSEENSISLEGTKLFYYEIYEFEYHEDEPNWRSFEPEKSFNTDVLIPNKKILEGFDVATFSVGTSPDCSPLSCNSLATEIKTNKHCLIDTLEEAKHSLLHGRFLHSEPGPFRIFAVYSMDWP